MTKKRLIFMGTPDFAVPALKSLLDSDHKVIAVYTQPPKPKGRGHKVAKSPVHLLADDNEIPVFTPKSLRNEDTQKEFQDLNADAAIVAAYGLLLPQEILDAPQFGCINIHGSLLPRWRGAAPIHRALLEGDTETGITLMQMDIGLDTGDMLAKESIKIEEHTTTEDLHDALSIMGARMLVPLIDDLDNLTPQIQDGTLATYAKKLEKSESALNFSKPADYLARQVRAFHPWPGSTLMWQGQSVKVLKALADADDISAFVGDMVISKNEIRVQCGKGSLLIRSLQLPGKKPMTADAFINGYHPESVNLDDASNRDIKCS